MRGRCPKCHYRWNLTKDGRIVGHSLYYGLSTQRVPCTGKRMMPLESPRYHGNIKALCEEIDKKTSDSDLLGILADALADAADTAEDGIRCLGNKSLPYLLHRKDEDYFYSTNCIPFVVLYVKEELDKPVYSWYEHNSGINFDLYSYIPGGLLSGGGRQGARKTFFSYSSAILAFADGLWFLKREKTNDNTSKFK